MKRGTSRLLSLLLVLCMVLALLPTNASAANSSASTEPKLTQLYVINSSGKRQSLLNGVITFTLGSSYSFEAVFTNSEQIDKVYVTSTREGETKCLEATRNGNSFVTSGYFDNDSTYVPSKIGVDFTKTVNSPEINEDVDWTAIASSIEDKSSTTISGSSSENVYATVDISELLESEAKAIVDIAIEALDEASGLKLIEDFNKLQSTKQDVEKYILGDGTELYLDYSKPSSQTMLVKDISSTTHKYYKMVLGTVEDSVSGENLLKLDQVSEALGSINLVSGMLNDYFSVSADADDLRQQVDNRYTTSEKREELYEAIDRYEKNRQAFTTVMTITSLVATTSDAIMPGATLVFNALVGIINASAQKFWEYQIGMILGTEPVETNLVGDYHGVPLRGETVTESGYYCATYNGTYTFENVTAKLCLHGLDNVKIVNKGGDITICDYTYYESADGTVYMGHADNTISEGGNITIESGDVGRINLDETETARIYGGDVLTIAAKGDTEVLINEGNVSFIENDGGNVTISGGKIKQVTNKSGIVEIGDGIVGDGIRDAVDNYGTVNIAGGIIYSNSRYSAIRNRTGGTLRITGGTIVSSDSMDAISGTGTVLRNDGNAEIINGTFAGCIYGYGGEEIVITGGQFCADGTANNSIIAGAFTINGGTFKASGTCKVVRVFGPHTGITKATINGGSFESENGPCVQVDQVAEITIHGGTFTSGGEQCVANYGTATITAGTFTENNSNSWSDCILNGTRGTMFIHGGTFYEFDGRACVRTESDNLTISGGKFLGGSYGIDNRVGESCTIIIGEDTDIIVEAGIRAFDLNLLFAAEEGYSGGVTYYNSPDAQGTPMTIEQAAAIDYTQSFVSYARFVADGVSDNPDSDSNDTTTLPAPTDLTWGKLFTGSGGEWKDVPGAISGKVSADTDRVNINIYRKATDGGEDTLVSGGNTICFKVGNEYVFDSDVFFLQDYYEGVGNELQTGTYYYIATPQKSNGTFSFSNSVKSSEWIYNRPSARIDITEIQSSLALNGQTATWDLLPEENEALYYAIELLYSKNKIDDPNIENLEKVVTMLLKYNDQPWYNFSEDDFSKDGYYYVRFRVISSDITQRLNSRWSELSNAYYYDTSTSSGTPEAPSGPTITPSAPTYPSGSASTSQSYTITVQSPILNGTVEASRTNAAKGTKVTITVTSDDGYQLETLVVKDANGNTVNIDTVDDNSYGFIMPGSSVTISATFVWINPFTDLSESDWFYDDVAYVVGSGLMVGVGNQRFDPSGTTTRRMIMTILARLAGVDTSGGDPWYQLGMEWAVKEGVSDGTHPEGEITREQFATMLWRYAGKPSATGDLSAYPDADKVHDWASDAMIWAVQNGIVYGTDGGRLDPQGNALRCQAAALLTRFCEKIVK